MRCLILMALLASARVVYATVYGECTEEPQNPPAEKSTAVSLAWQADVKDKSDASTPKNVDSDQDIACGVAHHQSVSLQSSSSGATLYGEFPWMLGILSNEYKNSSAPWNYKTYRGVATLIGPRAAITRIINVYKKLLNETIKVRAGDWNTNNDDEMIPYVESLVLKILQPEIYKPPTYGNSVVLLILETPILRTETVGYACLPPPGVLPPYGESCYSVSWNGEADDSESNDSSSFKKDLTKITDSKKCKAAIWYIKAIEAREIMMCAERDLKKDIHTCWRSRVPPLVCPITNTKSRYMLYGIGFECWWGRFPLYANMSFYRSWIDEQMEAEGLDTSTYTY